MGGAFDTYKLSKISSIKGLSFRRLSLDTPTIKSKVFEVDLATLYGENLISYFP